MCCLLLSFETKLGSDFFFSFSKGVCCLITRCCYLPRNAPRSVLPLLFPPLPQRLLFSSQTPLSPSAPFPHLSGRFIGTNAFALKGSAFESDDGKLTNGNAYASWLFQWAFAATAATVVSGAVAERVAFNAYVIYSIVLTSFIYPVVVHWGWGGGWASAWVEEDLLFDCGVIDFAGSGVVHMTGGVAALCAAIVVGPRIGRFNENGTANTLPQQSAVLQVCSIGFDCFDLARLLERLG